jgi:hypothetical protein
MDSGKEEIRRSRFRDNISLHQSPAANLDSIIHGLNDHRPRIVHFSGHGADTGIATDGGGIKRIKRQFVTFGTLAKALGATDTQPDVAVLNAGNSAGARSSLLSSVKAMSKISAAPSSARPGTVHVGSSATWRSEESDGDEFFVRPRHSGSFSVPMRVRPL